MESLAFIITVSMFVAAIIIVAIIQVSITARARMSVAREDAYHKLAEQSASVDQKTSEELQKISSDLSEIRNRLSGIEKILREVE